jgi:hypothetical protein
MADKKFKPMQREIDLSSQKLRLWQPPTEDQKYYIYLVGASRECKIRRAISYDFERQRECEYYRILTTKENFWSAGVFSNVYNSVDNHLAEPLQILAVKEEKEGFSGCYITIKPNQKNEEQYILPNNASWQPIIGLKSPHDDTLYYYTKRLNESKVMTPLRTHLKRLGSKSSNNREAFEKYKTLSKLLEDLEYQELTAFFNTVQKVKPRATRTFFGHTLPDQLIKFTFFGISIEDYFIPNGPEDLTTYKLYTALQNSEEYKELKRWYEKPSKIEAAKGHEVQPLQV